MAEWKNRFGLLLLLSEWLFSGTAWAGLALQVAVTCDNNLKFYADGVLRVENNNWPTTNTVAIPLTTRVLAIDCVDLHVVGGILASVSNGMVTDRHWKCSSRLVPGWTGRDFDDSAWTNAHEIGPNSMAPWGRRAKISSSARWIWSRPSGWHGQDKHVYCRKTLAAPCSVDPKPDIRVAITCDNQMKFYADGTLRASNDDWTHVTTATIPADTNVVAVDCRDQGVIGGILASFSSGVATDDGWKCSTTAAAGWDTVYFDDSGWHHAYEIATNQEGRRPWRTLPGIAGFANWIWTGANTWHGLHKHVYCRRQIGKMLKVMATCDNEMKLYADGHLIVSSSDWTQTSYANIPANTRVVAIECVDRGVVGGILAAIDKDKVTDSSWRCSSQPQAGWNRPEFDDRRWHQAYVIGPNGRGPWDARPGISPAAKWIWTRNIGWIGLDKHVYCRLDLGCGVQPTVTPMPSPTPKVVDPRALHRLRLRGLGRRFQGALRVLRSRLRGRRIHARGNRHGRLRRLHHI